MAGPGTETLRVVTEVAVTEVAGTEIIETEVTAQCWTNAS